jgi:hypothetical protein
MRNMLAQLSPREENTLRRIAGGKVIRRELREGDVIRLERLALVEDVAGLVYLTEVGTRRHANLDGSERWIAETASADSRSTH